jgi:Uma2 family endonuclease
MMYSGGMKRMGDPALEPDDHFTYRQYKTWPDTERWELIDGHAWSMSPAPRPRHQTLLGKLHLEFGTFLRGKPCIVFLAPFDVLIPRAEEPDDEVDTVVQPDLVVFCERSRVTEKGSRGAPDVAVEILSPSTSKKDLNEKFRLYERSGVREYWVVDPGNRSILVYRRGNDGRFDQGELREPVLDFSPIVSEVLVGLSIDPEDLFADIG